MNAPIKHRGRIGMEDWEHWHLMHIWGGYTTKRWKNEAQLKFIISHVKTGYALIKFQFNLYFLLINKSKNKYQRVLRSSWYLWLICYQNQYEMQFVVLRENNFLKRLRNFVDTVTVLSYRYWNASFFKCSYEHEHFY